MPETMKAQEIRPKVFVDPDGAEWRCVGEKLQVRVADTDHPEYDEATERGPLNDYFENSSFSQRDIWLAYLAKHSPQSLPATEQAIAHPMTAEEAAADDEAF